MPYEVYFGETNQLSNEESISMDACFHGFMFLPQASDRKEVALLVIFPSEAGVPFTSNSSCYAVGSSHVQYFG